jgi:hypothetical protein
MKTTFLFIFMGMYAILGAKNLTIYKVATPPTIDANPSDWGSVWNTISILNPASTTVAMTGKFQMAYDSTNLYIIVEITDTTPNNDTVTIPNPWERDCNELYFSMDTITTPAGYDTRGYYPAGKFHKGCWIIRKQRIPLVGGVGGIYFNINNEPIYNVEPLISSNGFSVASNGLSDTYYIEWQIPWSILTSYMDKDVISILDQSLFKFDIYVSDNTTGSASGRTQQNSWVHEEKDYEPYFNTNDLGLIILSKPLNIHKMQESIIGIFPNPIHAVSQIEIYNNRYNTLIITDLYGRQVKILNIQNQTSIVFSRQGMPSGMYFVRLLGKQKSSEVYKVVIN